MDRQFDDEDEIKAVAEPGARYHEFECPSCNAHNPYDEGFTDGSEILCFYCGTEFKVKVADGRMKLKEV